MTVLLLDKVESLVLVVVQSCFDVLVASRLDIIDVVSEDNRILHRVDRTGTAGWEELTGRKYNKTATRDNVLAISEKLIIDSDSWIYQIAS